MALGGGGAQTPMPAPPVKTEITAIETLLQNLLHATPASPPRTGHLRRYWTTVECFTCGKPGQGVTRCPALHVAFPFILPGWKAEKVGCG